MVTIRDVAKASRVSTASVSIVLNNAPLARHVAAATKERILRVAKEMGYRPNVLARSLRRQNSHTLGILTFDIRDPFCTGVLEGAFEAMYAVSYLPFVADVRNERKRFEQYLEMLLERRVEGLLVIANWLFMDIDLPNDLAQNKIPTVIVGTLMPQSGVPTVITDNEAGGYAAMEHLYALGHRKIAFLRGPRMLTDAALRWRGVRAFSRSRKLRLEPKLVLDLPSLPDPFSGFEAGKHLTGQLLHQNRRFTALLAYDDMTALGAIRALVQSGLSVPNDCSVVGFDDIAPAALGTPALTTVRQPLERLGSVAVDTVLKAIRAVKDKTLHGVARQPLVIVPELVVRETTGPRG